MNVLLLLAHSIAEYDDLRMLTDLGYDVFSVGAYSDPRNPGDSMRPPLGKAPDHPELRALCIEQREKHALEPHGEQWAIDWAKADLHPKLLEWADVVIAHHYLDRWIAPQFPRISEQARVIWRTCGQSDPQLEMLMKPLVDRGLRIVRYSPKERETFHRLGAFAGEHYLIRFGKYLSDYPAWIGGDYVANVTQDMAGRGDFCGLSYWLAETQHLNARPAGPHSEKLPGGVGALSYPDMIEYLQHAGVYLYTGTAPASYTLGLIEAMAVGVPLVTMPSSRFMVPSLYEASEIVGDTEQDGANGLHWFLHAPPEDREAESTRLRARAQDIFGIDHVSAAWAEVLG